MEKIVYSLAEAARAAEIEEVELRLAIRDGLLRARSVQNGGEYLIDLDELRRYLKRTRHTDVFSRRKPRRVLLLGEESGILATLLLELKRDPRWDVRYASWGKDGVLQVIHFEPHLYVVDLSPSKGAPDEVLYAIRSRQGPEGSRVLATFAYPPEMLASYPLVQSRLDSLRPDLFLTRSFGTRAVLVACHNLMGLSSATQALRRQA